MPIMRKQFAVICFTLALLLISITATKADPEECRNAVDQYNSARSDVSDALRIYASCISGSDGHDDCSTEFLRCIQHKTTSNRQSLTTKARANRNARPPMPRCFARTEVL